MPKSNHGWRWKRWKKKQNRLKQMPRKGPSDLFLRNFARPQPRKHMHSVARRYAALADALRSNPND